VQRTGHVNRTLHRRPHVAASPSSFFGLDMRRLALMAAMAVALPASAGAQACLGSVSFGTIPVRLGGGAFFGPSFSPYNNNEVFAASDMSGVYHSTNLGTRGSGKLSTQ